MGYPPEHRRFIDQVDDRLCGSAATKWKGHVTMAFLFMEPFER
jgi:hypothetical protein